MHLRKICFFIPCLFISNLCLAQIAPFKNELFKNNKVLRKAYSSQFLEVDYNEARDVNGRDEIPVDKALNERVELLPHGYESSKSIKAVNINIAGNIKKFNFAVIFIHGKGGNKNLGFDDWTFGGNFNRLKNLVIRSGGVYLSPSAQLNSNGANKIGEVILTLKKTKPNAPIILSCGSAGGIICWEIAKSNTYSGYIDGLVFLGTAVNDKLNTQSLFFKNKKPIIFAHGSLDPILPWQNTLNTFEKLRSRGIPTKYYLYRTGIHGTPIRMIDWYEALNWIL